MIDELNEMIIEDKVFELSRRILVEQIHQKAKKIDEETTAYINDYLDKHPEVKELWEKEKMKGD